MYIQNGKYSISTASLISIREKLDSTENYIKSCVFFFSLPVFDYNTIYFDEEYISIISNLFPYIIYMR